MAELIAIEWGGRTRIDASEQSYPVQPVWGARAAAPLLRDNSPGDTSTGYSSPTSDDPYLVVFLTFDTAVQPTSVDFTRGSYVTLAVVGVEDVTAWPSVNVGTTYSGAGTSTVPGAQFPAPHTYWALVFYKGFFGPGGIHVDITDLRVTFPGIPTTGFGLVPAGSPLLRSQIL